MLGARASVPARTSAVAVGCWMATQARCLRYSVSAAEARGKMECVGTAGVCADEDAGGPERLLEAHAGKMPALLCSGYGIVFTTVSEKAVLGMPSGLMIVTRRPKRTPSENG